MLAAVAEELCVVYLMKFRVIQRRWNAVYQEQLFLAA